MNARVLWMDVGKINKRKKEEGKPEMELDYYDETSLFPSQMVYGFYPGGKPVQLYNPDISQVIYGDDEPLSKQEFDYIDATNGVVKKDKYFDFLPGRLKYGRYMVRIVAPPHIKDSFLKLQVTDEITKQKKINSCSLLHL